MTVVSGIVRDTQGNALANAIVTAEYKRPVVGSNGGAAVQNARTFTADGNGLVTMSNMLAGAWDVYFFIPVNDSTDQTLIRAGTMVILDQATQTLESALTETIGTITPSILQQAIEAKEAAEAAKDAAEGFRDDALLSEAAAAQAVIDAGINGAAAAQPFAAAAQSSANSANAIVLTLGDALLNDLGAFSVDENGDLIVSYIGNTINDIEIDVNGDLLVTYEVA